MEPIGLAMYAQIQALISENMIMRKALQKIASMAEPREESFCYDFATQTAKAALDKTKEA